MSDRIDPIRQRLAAERLYERPKMLADIRYLLDAIQANATALAVVRDAHRHADETVADLLRQLHEITDQRDAARAKLAEAWYEGVDAALERRTQLENPYLLPGEDGPR